MLVVSRLSVRLYSRSEREVFRTFAMSRSSRCERVAPFSARSAASRMSFIMPKEGIPLTACIAFASVVSRCILSMRSGESDGLSWSASSFAPSVGALSASIASILSYSSVFSALS